MAASNTMSLARRLTMIASGLVVAIGCFGLAALLLVSSSSGNLPRSWTPLLFGSFFVVLGSFGANLAWRGARSQRSAIAARATDAVLLQPAIFLAFGGVVFLLATSVVRAPELRVALALWGLGLFLLALVTSRAWVRQRAKPEEGLEQRMLLQVLDGVRPRKWTAPTSRCLEEARRGALGELGIVLALTAALDRGEHDVVEELLALGRAKETLAHRYDFDLIEVMHLALNVGDAHRARQALELATRDNPGDGYARLACATVLCAEGLHREAALQLEHWQEHVEKASAGAWEQAGNEWAEDALVSRLEAAGAIEVSSRRQDGLS